MIRLQNVLKMSWRRLENVLKTSWRRIAKTNILVLTKTSWRRLEDVFWRRMINKNIFVFIKTSWGRLLKTKTKDAFKTSSRRLHQDECLPGWLFPFLGHFCMPWELLHLISKYFLFVSLFIWLCIEIKLNGTCIFLLARPFIKQSRDLIG